MGRLALVSVMALATAFSIISINLRESGSEASRAQSDYIRYAAARNMARAAINMRLRAIDADTTGTALLTGTVSGDFNNATYTTTADTATLDTLRITAEGRYEGTTYRMQVKLYRYPKPFPQISAGVGIRVDDVKFDMSGNPKIYGNNHDINGNDLPGTDSDTTGVAVMNRADSAEVAAYGSKIFGNPKVKIDTTTADPGQFVDEYIANADYKYGPGVYSSITWGSATNPVIVSCYSPDTSSRVKFTGNVEGWGILVIRGNLEVAGNFKFHGLVIVYGENNVVTASASTGTPEIIGGFIIAGKSGSSFSMKGTADIKFSTQSLQNAKYIKRLLAYRIIEWWEQ